MGSSWNHKDTFRTTCINHTANMPSMYMMIKDHKQPDQEELPKTRPVVSSQNGMNVHLSNIISEVLEPLAERVGTNEIISSEDLLSKVDKVNKQLQTMHAEGKAEELNNMVLIGADAEALYPSLMKDISDEVPRLRLEGNGQIPLPKNDARTTQ